MSETNVEIDMLIERTGCTVCPACGSETADSNMLAVNKYVKQLEDKVNELESNISDVVRSRSSKRV